MLTLFVARVYSRIYHGMTQKAVMEEACVFVLMDVLACVPREHRDLHVGLHDLAGLSSRKLRVVLHTHFCFLCAGNAVHVHISEDLERAGTGGD